MSLFSALFNVGLLRRVGIWAAIQALPDENALRGYIRAAFLAVSVAIIGSVLTGAALSVGIISAYRLMLDAGLAPLVAVSATAGFTLLLILGCFYLAGRWLNEFVAIKDAVTIKAPGSGLTSLVSDAVTNVTEGFMEGFNSNKVQPKPPARRIKLIQ